MKPLQFYYSCLPALLLVYQRRVIFWLKMLNSNNLALHTFANCCKDSIIGTLEKYSVDRQLNLVSASLIRNILAAIICRCFIDFIVLFPAFFLVYCMCAIYVLVLFCCIDVINNNNNDNNIIIIIYVCRPMYVYFQMNKSVIEPTVGLP